MGLAEGQLRLGGEMERIYDAAAAEHKVLRDMQELVSEIRKLTEYDPVSTDDGSLQLRVIRCSVAENLNQIQHEYLILRGIRWLLGEGFGSDVEWEWNPRQTGSAIEPDLRGRSGGNVIVSAEATASENPIGMVDTRMQKTLEKLSRLQGKKFYFVATQSMAQRARSKVTKAGWPIGVVCCEAQMKQASAKVGV
jgi:hypothetical protein